MLSGELFSVFFSYANCGLRHRVTVIDRDPGPASALALLDKKPLEVLWSYSLGEAGSLYNGERFLGEGAAAKRHPGIRHNAG